MLIIAFLVAIAFIVFSIRKFGFIFNPFTLEVYFIILFIIVPQLVFMAVDPKVESNMYSDISIIVYLSAIFAGTMVSIRGVRFEPVRNIQMISLVNVLMYALLIIPILPLLLSFGLSPSGFRNFYQFVIFSKFASFYELSKVVLYFVIFYKLVQRQKFSLWFFVFFPFVFFYGSRFVILDFIIYLSVFLEQFRHLPFRKLALIGIGGAAAILVYSYLQFSWSNIYFSFYSYFDLYRNQSFLIQKLIDGKADYYYGEIYFSSYLKYIPRIFWPEKPVAFGFAILNYEFFPEYAKQGYMPSFGLGSLFADFGFPGLVFFGFMSGVLRRFLFNSFRKSRNNIGFFVFVLPLNFVTVGFLLLQKSIDEIISFSASRKPGSQPKELSQP